MTAYKLVQRLAGHEADVRGLCVSDVGLITTSRDKTAKIWTENADKKFTESMTLVGHTNYVGPALRYPPGLSPQLPHGAIVTGSRDTSVIVWDPVTGDKLHTLTGHQYQVTALALTLDGVILSGALDKTIRAWKDGQSLLVLEGHEGPVLCLLTLPNGDVLSGSGDTSIRRWSPQTGQCIATYTAHTDTVRALCLLPDVGFVSASHDHSIKVWTLEGEVVSELLGHTAIIYAVDASPSGLIASGSEDNSVRLWRADGSCIQTLSFVGCLWDVAFTPSEELVVACSDAAAYVWSASSQRAEDTEAAQALEAAITARAAAAAAAEAGGGGGGAAAEGGAAGLPPGLKVEEKYVLHERGSKDGETKVVREGDGSVWAYSWNAAQVEWEKIGEVVAAPAGSAGGNKDGPWDYSFNVDVSDGQGAPTCRLVGNYSENPYDVADRFLEQEGLPTHFKDQIVSFILANTGGRTAAPNVSNLPVTGGFCDPFTGGSGTSTTSQPPPAPFLPPPAAAPMPMDVTGGGVDPFTGGSSRSSTTSSSGQRCLPHTGLLLFDTPPPVPGLKKKLLEFNAVLQQAGAAQALSEEELGVCEALLSSLGNPTAAAQPPSPHTLQVVAKLLSFPKDQLFVALDITRMLLLDSGFASGLVPMLGSISSPSAGTLAGALATGLADPPVPAAQQTGAKLICNCFKHAAAKQWLADNCSGLLDLMGPAASSGNKNVRAAVATVLLNFTVLLAENGGRGSGEEVRLQLMGAVSELLAVDGVVAQEGETAHRALAAAGTLASFHKDMAALALDLGLDGVARQLLDQANAPQKTKAVAQEVLGLLAAK